MAIYAIGDIHGSLEALEAIFNQNIITKEDTVVFLGDYIDRGVNSKRVIDWLILNQSNYNFEFILGNHEIMMVTAKENPDQLMRWLYFGGSRTLDSYNIKDDNYWMDKIDSAHWAFIDACKPYLTIDDFIFVHAGLEIGVSLEEQDDDHLYWNKFEVPECYSTEKTVICGHTSRKDGEIADFGHTICIDTYAYGGKWLTCLNVGTKEYIKSNNEGEVLTGKL
tara:strand:+ start:2519 stop:3184 length:666 start_codon:yes stop_codon:yes gene_type:complete